MFLMFNEKVNALEEARVILMRGGDAARVFGMTTEK